jgi:hypothetical protein
MKTKKVQSAELVPTVKNSPPGIKKAQKTALSKIEALRQIKDQMENPTAPKVMGNKKVYSSRLHGVIWDPSSPISLKRMCTTITAMFLAQMNEQEVAEAMGVRYDVLHSWITRIPEIRQAKEDGMTDTRVKLINASLKRAMGYDYYEETATKNGPQRIQKHMAAEPKLATLFLQNMFRGKIVQQPETQTNNQFNIILSKADRRL